MPHPSQQQPPMTASSSSTSAAATPIPRYPAPRTPPSSVDSDRQPQQPPPLASPSNATTAARFEYQSLPAPPPPDYSPALAASAMPNPLGCDAGNVPPIPPLPAQYLLKETAPLLAGNAAAGAGPSSSLLLPPSYTESAAAAVPQVVVHHHHTHVHRHIATSSSSSSSASESAAGSAYAILDAAAARPLVDRATCCCCFDLRAGVLLLLGTQWLYYAFVVYCAIAWRSAFAAIVDSTLSYHRPVLDPPSDGGRRRDENDSLSPLDVAFATASLFILAGFTALIHAAKSRSLATYRALAWAYAALTALLLAEQVGAWIVMGEAGAPSVLWMAARGYAIVVIHRYVPVMRHEIAAVSRW
ncbi:hypothetical protein H9P43_005059 [Blastocladiella emersonii ATCC 22665]|nr:hypothetical protein H9P43_005059 [Blastocladiella emersonii ATCC 22665]